MKEYNPLNGVPRFSYYLEEIVCFGDFEYPEERKILYTSENKQELIDLCVENNWACREAGTSNSSGWDTHFIKWRAAL